ncbi:hypothetical protein B0H13DRAFT_1925656 [Mycena leptocephala]|nr:hypothetical protein B0H13DRAFT_1925656 [Mycena leptocephala]
MFRPFSGVEILKTAGSRKTSLVVLIDKRWQIVGSHTHINFRNKSRFDPSVSRNGQPPKLESIRREQSSQFEQFQSGDLCFNDLKLLFHGLTPQKNEKRSGKRGGMSEKNKQCNIVTKEHEIELCSIDIITEYSMTPDPHYRHYTALCSTMEWAQGLLMYENLTTTVSLILSSIAGYTRQDVLCINSHKQCGGFQARSEGWH